MADTTQTTNATSSLKAFEDKITLGGRHVTRDEILVIVSRRYSSQVRNREAARAQLLQLPREATDRDV